MVTTREISWLSGLLEGEGSFQLQSRCPRIVLAMTDREVVSKVAGILSTSNTISSHLPLDDFSHRGRKRLHYIRINGSIAAQWMMTLYTLMSARRQKQIRICLSAWKEARSYSNWNSKGRRLCVKST